MILRPLRPDGANAYLQAAGSAEAMTVQICKPTSDGPGGQSVRYVVGHEHTEGAPIEVEIALPRGTEIVSRYEVFNADEAAALVEACHQAGDIPAGCSLRPVQTITDR